MHLKSNAFFIILPLCCLYLLGVRMQAVLAQFVTLCPRILVFMSSCLRFLLFLLNRLFCCQNHCFSTCFELCSYASTAFGSHMRIRQVETFSNAVQYSSGELPLQSQSLRASIISKGRQRQRKTGKGRGGRIVISLYVCIVYVLHVADQ